MGKNLMNVYLHTYTGLYVVRMHVNKGTPVVNFFKNVMQRKKKKNGYDTFRNIKKREILTRSNHQLTRWSTNW